MSESLTQARPEPVVRRATVLAHERVAEQTFRLRFLAPDIAARILPGQFVMVRAADRTDPLLARPFALWEVVDQSSIEVIYLVVGNGTRCLSRLTKGADLNVWGPMGNTFPVQFDDAPVHLGLVAGGIGQTPFLAVAREMLGQARYGAGRAIDRPRSITLYYGARSSSLLAGVKEFEDAGVSVRIATDDGSLGHKGFVTELVEKGLGAPSAPNVLFGCGPEPMLQSLSKLASAHGVPCWVSLETRMACGYGVCFSCVAPVLEGSEADCFDYRRVCLEGPVFKSTAIAWSAMTVEKTPSISDVTSKAASSP